MMPTEPTRTNLDAIRRTLLQRQRALFHDVDGLEDDLRLLDESHPAERAEVAQEEAMARLLERVREHDRHEAEEIQRALGKIAAGAYGACERCHEPIAIARLEATPETRVCIDCQRTLEAPGSRG